MSSDIAIKIENISKCYQVYEKPHDRLKQYVFPRLQQMVGQQPKQYFHEFWALRDISFEVKKGESVGIVGRNGSGKSTLLQLITGTLSPTSGQIITSGRIAALLELGSGFNPEFTGRENVYLNGALLGLSSREINDRFDAIAAFADIGEHLYQPVKTYSSGMLVRLAFAVQVQVEPDILIVDEALAVGDVLFQKRCFQRIEKLISNGTTLLFVSHEQESIRTLTHKALLLNKGRSHLIGLSSDVVLEYRRILHEEEKAIFREKLNPEEKIAGRIQFPTSTDETQNLEAARHLKLKSFGKLEAEIIEVKIFDAEGIQSNYFQIGDEIIFLIKFRANIDLIGLNVAFRIRNKEGVKVTSWGTLNDDIKSAASGVAIQNLFWGRRITAGATAAVRFRMTCPLATNFYELQVTVTKEHDMYYGAQEILHWKDEAAFFSVVVKPREYIVGGICDLGFKYEFLIDEKP